MTWSCWNYLIDSNELSRGEDGEGGKNVGGDKVALYVFSFTYLSNNIFVNLTRSTRTCTYMHFTLPDETSN